MDQTDLIRELRQIRQKHLPLNEELISAIDKKLGFEVLISGLSAKFSTGMMENIEKEIEDGLRMIVEYFGLDRSTLFSFSDDRSRFVSKYSFARSDTPVIKTEIGADLFPQVYKVLLNGKFIWFSSYDDLPKEFRKDIQSFKNYHLSAGFIVPVFINQEVKYALAGGLATSTIKKWSFDLLSRIQFLGEILAGAIERWEVKKELTDSEKRYRFIFEQGPVGIGLIDRDYFWIKTNPRFCEMLGYTEEELKALKWTDITHPDDLERDIQQAEQVFKGEIPFFTMEKRFFKKDGEIIWVSLTPTAIKDNNGAL